MNYPRPLSILLLMACSGGAAAVTACETETPTPSLIENAYPAPPDGGDPTKQTVVYRAWWVSTSYPEPLAGGTSSSEFRSVPATDFAYAVLAPGWDPASTSPPTRLLVVKSKGPLEATRGETLRITVSTETFTGDCDAKQPLSQDDADFITQRIFPGAFANRTYDARTCVTTAVTEAGADGGPDGGADGGRDGAADARPG